MNTFFKELVEAYKVSTSTTVKSALYDAMVSYSKTYRGDYSCYDMDMFTTLYKCASTPAQRKDALNQMYAIIVDPALHYDELVENFKEFFSLNEVLANDDIDQFDNTCYYFLKKFRKQYVESKVFAKAGMNDFLPDVPVNDAKGYLRQAIDLVLKSGFKLECYLIAEAYAKEIWVKKLWEPSQLFSNTQKSRFRLAFNNHLHRFYAIKSFKNVIDSNYEKNLNTF